MTKLKLDIADLRVESFETTVERVGGADMVVGQSWETQNTYCYDYPGCEGSTTCATEVSTCLPATQHEVTNCHNECVE